MTRRAEIRHRVTEMLLTPGPDVSGGYPTEARNRVYPSRKRKLSHTQLPCLLVYTNSESCEVFNESPRSYKKTLALVIGVVAEENETLDDDLDRICGQVERVFNENVYLGKDDGGLVDECNLTRTELGFSVDCDVQTGGAAMTFEVVYYEDAVSSGEVEPNRLVPFKTVTVETKPACATSQEDTPAQYDEIALEWR